MNNIKNTQIVENERYKRIRFYSVMTEEKTEIYLVSKDKKELRVDVKKALEGAPRRMPRRSSHFEFGQTVRSEHIHTYLEMNVPDFYDKVECLILCTQFFHENDILTLDAERLLEVFPNLKMVCCRENIVINNAVSKLRVLDPFEVGEYSFELAKNRAFDEAYRYMRILRGLDRKWLEFWGKVAREYRRKPEENLEDAPNSPIVYNGMDDLFRIYFLGWYAPFPINEEHKVYVKKHKNLEKAIELLPIRFRNCSLNEVSEKLYWDLQYVEADCNPDFDNFFRVLAETELLYPGALDQMFEDWWMNDAEKEKLLNGMTRAANAMKGII